ncbi:hypothetical protein QBC43DRAFT_64089 [Cladorrhinum sp. PSN259]|nr:hypothetical protein QBC43DRAFT_64089 [Cladorrhinum sp. PSN259]
MGFLVEHGWKTAEKMRADDLSTALDCLYKCRQSSGDLLVKCGHYQFMVHKTVFISQCQSLKLQDVEAESVLNPDIGKHEVTLKEIEDPEVLEHLIEYVYTGTYDEESQFPSSFERGNSNKHDTATDTATDTTDATESGSDTDMGNTNDDEQETTVVSEGTAFGLMNLDSDHDSDEDYDSDASTHNSHPEEEFDEADDRETQQPFVIVVKNEPDSNSAIIQNTSDVNDSVTGANASTNTNDTASTSSPNTTVTNRVDPSATTDTDYAAVDEYLVHKLTRHKITLALRLYKLAEDLGVNGLQFLCMERFHEAAEGRWHELDYFPDIVDQLYSSSDLEPASDDWPSLHDVVEALVAEKMKDSEAMSKVEGVMKKHGALAVGVMKKFMKRN